MRVERTARMSRLIKEGAVRTDRRDMVTRVCGVGATAPDSAAKLAGGPEDAQ